MGRPVILLHGWPYDIYSYVDVAPLLASAGYRVIVPYLRGYGTTRFLSSDTVRNGQQAAVAVDIIALMDALGIEKAIIAGYDWGARTANIVAALWPERCKALVSVSGYLIGSQEANKMPLPPKAELQWWYQYLFRHRARPRRLRQIPARFCQAHLADSLRRNGSSTTPPSTAARRPSTIRITSPSSSTIIAGGSAWLKASRNMTIWKSGWPKPRSSPCPTITLEGDANGAPHPDPSAYAKKFSGKYAHRLITGGIGHNLPQEAPQAFAQAVIDVDRA